MSDGIVGAIAISLFGSEKKRRDSMDAGYTILGNDVDVCRMLDPFSYKRNESLDFSLSVPQHHLSTIYHPNGYAMTDQTFHTPSFGDEDFDIPAIHSHSHQQQQQQQPHQAQQQSQHDPMHGYTSQMMQTSGVQQSQDGLNLDPGGYQQPPLYLQQDHSMQPITVSSTYSGSQSTYASMSSPRQQHENQQQMLLLQQQQQQQQAQIQQHMQYMHSQQQQHQHQQQQQQQQQHLQQQIQYRSPTGGSPSAIQVGSVPEANNNNTTTSEDSDDSTPHSGMITGIKRPSPEPADVGTKNQRKPKSQKKKKKRDPNEPQKPVSAYALFFRDTQAVIKGQNPNASFGEVSKIVASMWDALDTEHKNVYKKKTEAAKKEYLQALAAYRASLVSKGAAESEQQPPGQQQPSTQQQPQQQVQYATYGNYAGNGTSANVSYQVYSPQPQPSSPQQQHPHSHSHQHHQQSTQQMQMKKSSHHLTMSGNPQQQQQQTQQTLMTNSMTTAHISQQQHMQQQHPQQQYMQMSQQQQQQQIMHTSPPKNDSMSSPPPAVNSANQAGSVTGQRPTSNACIRHGCPNPAVANSEWEDEYCSNECVVSHCRDVFTTWVSSNQNPQQNFSTVK